MLQNPNNAAMSDAHHHTGVTAVLRQQVIFGLFPMIRYSVAFIILGTPFVSIF